ncbi:hypothetical protein ACFL35_10305 [Candidatus Riflebacteria bacterium]
MEYPTNFEHFFLIAPFSFNQGFTLNYKSITKLLKHQSLIQLPIIDYQTGVRKILQQELDLPIANFLERRVPQGQDVVFTISWLKKQKAAVGGNYLLPRYVLIAFFHDMFYKYREYYRDFKIKPEWHTDFFPRRNWQTSGLHLPEQYKKHGQIFPAREIQKYYIALQADLLKLCQRYYASLCDGSDEGIASLKEMLHSFFTHFFSRLQREIKNGP